MFQPDKYSIDRTTALSQSSGERLEIVVLQLEVKGVTYTFAMTKEDAVVLGMELMRGADDAKRITDVKRGVGIVIPKAG